MVVEIDAEAHGARAESSLVITPEVSTRGARALGRLQLPLAF